jgi:hypothetical protein
MSNQQKQHQYYEGDHNMSAQDEVDAMLNSLVGQTRPGGSYNNNPSYAEQQQYNNNVS